MEELNSEPDEVNDTATSDSTLHKTQRREGGEFDKSTHLARSFACIAMFESGEFNLDPSSLQSVFALSTGGSIFVASASLADPSADSSLSPIRRVFGNLGRLVNHESFDRQVQDSFRLTSLHLSFTDFELTVDVGARGLRDSSGSC